MMRVLYLYLLFVTLPVLSAWGNSVDVEAEAASWSTRVLVASQEPICERAAVRLELDDPSGDRAGSLQVPLVEGEIVDNVWALGRLAPGSYTLSVDAIQCSGLSGESEKLRITVSESEIRKIIYVSVRFERATPHLEYVEASTSWNGNGLLVVQEEGGKLFLRNLSDVPIRRCEYRFGDSVNREYEVGGLWSEFNRPRSYHWPEDAPILAPGEQVALESEKVIVIGYDPNAKRVRPSAKRFRIPVGPRMLHYYAAAGRESIPLGLPSCDYFYVTVTTTEADPQVELNGE